jgi:hypothetical protein
MFSSLNKFLLFLLCVTSTACVPSSDKAIALKAIEQYHQRYNQFRFHEIYQESTAGMKTNMPEERFLESIKAMRQGQGSVVKATELTTDYFSSPDEVEVKILMRVDFEKGSANEEFVYTISQDKATLSGYRFLSPGNP